MENLRSIFEIQDVFGNGNGKVTIDEFKVIVKSYQRKLNATEKELDTLAEKLFGDASLAASNDEDSEEPKEGPSAIREISIERLLDQIDQQQRLLAGNKTPIPEISTWKRMSAYICNRFQEIVFVILVILVQAAIIAYAIYEYVFKSQESKDPLMKFAITLAKACAFNLDFLCFLTLLFMMRKAISFLRTIRFGQIFPLDYAIINHQVVGYAIGLYALGHTIGQVINHCELAPTMRQINGTDEKSTINYTCAEFLFTAHRYDDDGIRHYTAITGWILVAILLLMTATSLPCIRRSGKFELFYFTHLLFVAFYVICVVHCRNFWMFIVGPAILYLLEIFWRTCWSTFQSTYVVEGVLLPSDVVHLVIKRPEGFNFKPGDWVYARIPAIAWMESHPFTISSAPEMPDFLWLHIRATGSWTNRLYNYFLREEEKMRRKIGDNVRKSQKKRDRPKTFYELARRSTIFALPRPTNTSGPNDRGLNKISRVVRGLSNRFSSYANLDETSYGTFEAGGRYRDSLLINPNATEALNSGRMVKLDKELLITLDGPFGSPTADLFYTEHAVLIAGGIGVTPFASILQSLMYRYLQTKKKCPACLHSWTDPTPADVMRLKKVDFLWINRDHNSFEWFVNLLSQLEITQALLGEQERFLDIHMYVTSATNKLDPQIFGLHLTLDLLHEKGKRKNLMDGLKARTNPGRPDFNQFFQSIREQQKGVVTVFFCGPPHLASVIQKHCTQFSFNFKKEEF